MKSWTDLKTDPNLLRLLERATQEGMSPAELFEQRVSWVWSMQDVFTKDEVRRRLADAPLPSTSAQSDPDRWNTDRSAIQAALRCAGLELLRGELGYRVQSIDSTNEATLPPVGVTAEAMPEAQEPKYTVANGAIVNRASGQPIPFDEPVFIFRARDKLAVRALENYAEQVGALAGAAEHYAAIRKRVKSFRAFASRHPERMKLPDTASTPCAPTRAAKP